MFSARDIIKATRGHLILGSDRRNFAGVCIDTRILKEGEIFVAIIGKKFDGHDFIPEALRCGARGVVYSNPRKLKQFQKSISYIKVEDTITALGAIAKFHRRRFDIPVIAVTGSSGKTTTKEMISWVLSAKYKVLKNVGTQNNLIGVPLTLLKVHSQHDICVIEMGTNQMGEIRQLAKIASPNMGIITNIGPAHLEFLKSLKGVYKEKTGLLRYLVPPGIVLLNKSDVLLTKLSRIRSKAIFFFGINADCDFRASEITLNPKSISFMFNKTHPMEIRHCALHNVSNALVAVGCGLIFGLDIATIKKRIGAFDSPDMRLKEIGLRRNIVFDDSYNSNPQSLKQAIDVLCRQPVNGRRILVMGDMLELGKKSEEFHAYFGRYVSKKPIDVLITMGEFSRIAALSAKKSGMEAGCVFHFDTCPQVLKFLQRNTRDGDIFLIKGSRMMRMDRIVTFFKERG